MDTVAEAQHVVEPVAVAVATQVEAVPVEVRTGVLAVVVDRI